MRAAVAWTAWLLPLVSACSAPGPPTPVRTVDELIAHEQELLGRKVTVEGLLRFGDDSHNLWSSRAAYRVVEGKYLPDDDPAWNHCIALYDLARWRTALLANDHGRVRLTGVLQRRIDVGGEVVNLSECNDLGLSIESVDVKK